MINSTSTAARLPLREEDLDSFATLTEIIGVARGVLPTDILDFLEGGAGEERTLRDNRTAFRNWNFVPRVMTGYGKPELATSFLGIPLAIPVLTAPFGADGLFHPRGQCAVARANAAEGVASIVPEAGTYSFEVVAEAAPDAARIAQIHPMGSAEHFVGMLHRIENAGYQAICVTVDFPIAGRRERDLMNRFDRNFRAASGNYPADGSAASETIFKQLFYRSTAGWGWGQLGELMDKTPLPWIAKGVLTGADACAALEAGADAVLVSNHGGRQLDGVPAALNQLPEVVSAVAGRVPVAFDSGIRRGSDIVIALALGADVVVLGRLVAYGLAADGESGVRQVHQLLRAEMLTTLTLLGAGDVAVLEPSVLSINACRRH
ncbi:alpha-hydroxy acid oxidase [Pseudonocardia alaniniphila]|uniref:Alpha-hydroxy-acid oxidizing protein n=1 Tax=Pseudonocardia alaniniphila TaxID=75291 RepID=A0ABS9T9A1_9PSEU|nr:alpha-hydroxy acid oxidase [Pseudonocardia alaniniphila]MCH6165112.1 alpha-hydroxy-acid oxidizing protein [Pseudonocardia alaniniphila]